MDIIEELIYYSFMPTNVASEIKQVNNAPPPRWPRWRRWNWRSRLQGWPPWKRAAVIVVAIVIVFAALNAPFFWQNIRFSLLWQGTPPPQTASQSSQPVGQPNLLEIPSLNISVPIIYVTEQSEKSYQAGLAHGVVHFPGTPEPGQAGNVYIFGHSSDFLWSRGQYKTVFALLPRIENGAEIRISDTGGRQFIYKIFEQKVVAANDLSVLDQGDGAKKLLTLQTSYPIGTALRRYVVMAELVE